MTDEQWRGFDRDGCVLVPAALSGDEVARYAAALDRVYAAAERAGALAADGSLHRLSAVASCPEQLGVGPRAGDRRRPGPPTLVSGWRGRLVATPVRARSVGRAKEERWERELSMHPEPSAGWT